jgi:hypothetical protein
MATGPSLTEEVVEYVREHKGDHIVFGCNDVYKICDFMDVHYACDTRWWEINGKDFREKFPDQESWTQCKGSATKFNLEWTNGKHNSGFSVDPNLIHFGSNSGYQQLNIAFLMGCNKFILLGYNMRHINGKSHFFGDHQGGMNNSSPYKSFLQKYETIQEPIKKLIVNCTADSALRAFRKEDLKEALNV